MQNDELFKIFHSYSVNIMIAYAVGMIKYLQVHT